MYKSAFRISVLFFLIGVLWIYLSDRLVLSFLSFDAPQNITLFQSLKGTFFILCTSLLLYFLIRQNSRNLLSSEQQYRQLFNDNPNPMWIYEVSSLRILAVNETAIQKYGYSKEEFLNLKLEDLKPAESIPDLYKTRTSRKEEDHTTGSSRHRKKNGETFFVQLDSRPTLFQHKKARLVVALDVNEKILAEEKSKEIGKQLNDFRYAVSSATIVSALDGEGNLSWVNENFCRLSQYSSNELIGKNYQMIGSEQQRPVFTSILKNLKSGRSWRGEMMKKAKDGNFFWLDTSIVPIQNREGEVTQFVSISTDITEKKQVQEKLIQREKLLSSLINSQSSYLIRLTECGEFTYANARYLQKFGFTEDSIGNNCFQNLLRLKDVKQFDQARKACLQNPGEIIPVELYTKIDEEKGSWITWEFIGIQNANDCSFEIQGMGLDNTKRKIAEQELEKFEKRFNKVLDSINEAFFTLDKDWKFLKVNKQFEKVIRLKREEIVGRCIWTIFPDIADTLLAQNLKVAMEDKIPFTFEEEYPGRGVTFQISIFPIKEGVSGYFRDVTKKKEAEKQIKQAAERYDTLTKATFDTIWEWDLANDKLNWNDGIKTNFKYSKISAPDSLKRWGEKVHPDDYQRVVNGIQETIKKGKRQWEEEYRILCGDGSYRYISDRGYVIYDDQQKPVRMIGAMQDVHQQREYQQEIKKLSLVAEKTQNAVIITDRNGLIEWVNEGFTRITEWSAEEVINRKPGKFLQGPGTDAETLEMIRLNLLKKERFSAELINYTKSGNPYWVRMDVSPILDEKGELIKYISIETDITERKQFEELLKKQNEKLKEIAWISSHDIRRPVASILGLISLYDLDDPTKPFNKEIITLLNTSTKELDRVIRKIVYKTYEVDEMKESNFQTATNTLSQPSHN